MLRALTNQLLACVLPLPRLLPRHITTSCCTDVQITKYILPLGSATESLAVQAAQRHQTRALDSLARIYLRPEVIAVSIEDDVVSREAVDLYRIRRITVWCSCCCCSGALRLGSCSAVIWTLDAPNDEVYICPHVTYHVLLEVMCKASHARS